MLYEGTLTKCSPLVTLSTQPKNALTRRTRTPPDLKWLLNERAALAGAVETAVARQALLAVHLQQAERQRFKLTAALAGTESALAHNRATVAALDVTIRLAYAHVEPTAGGVVNALAGKYGKRGALTQFISQTLKDASPAPVDTKQLINHVALHFQLSLPLLLPSSRTSLRTSIKTVLYRLAHANLVELLHAPSCKTPGVWRWKQLPTIAELAGMAAQAGIAAAPASTPTSNPTSTVTAGEPTRKAASDGHAPAADAHTP